MVDSEIVNCRNALSLSDTLRAGIHNTSKMLNQTRHSRAKDCQVMTSVHNDLNELIIMLMHRCVYRLEDNN